MKYYTEIPYFSLNHKEYKKLYLLLVLSPLSALFSAIYDYKNVISRKIVFIVLVLYGLSMNLVSDSGREAMLFIDWGDNNFTDLLQYIKDLYLTDNAVDFLQAVIMFLVSRITSNPNIYFGIIATIFAYFYLKSINGIYDIFNPSLNYNSLVHFWLFCILLPVFYISGSRWAIATWVFFFGIYNYLIQRKIKYIFIGALSIFFHFSYWGPVLVFLVYLILGKRNILYYLLIILSFIIQPRIAPTINEIKTESFSGIQERLSKYTTNEYIQLRQKEEQRTKWYVKYPIKMLWFYFIIGIIYGRKRFKNFSREEILETLYSYSLFLFAFVNSFLKVPSGGRFRMIFLMFATLYLIILFSKAKPKGLSKITYIGLIPMLLYFVLEFRRGLETLNILLVFPIPSAFIEKITLF